MIGAGAQIGNAREPQLDRLPVDERDDLRGHEGVAHRCARERAIAERRAFAREPREERAMPGCIAHIHRDGEPRLIERRIEEEVIGLVAVEERRDKQLAPVTKPDPGALDPLGRSEHVAQVAAVGVVDLRDHRGDRTACVVIDEEADRIEHVAECAQVRDEARGVGSWQAIRRAQRCELGDEIERTRAAMWRARARVIRGAKAKQVRALEREQA